MSRFYVTTPIYYVNDVPHLGTAYTTVVTDAVRRYHLLRGHETRMLTGTDEHGQKLEREARSRGMAPELFVREMSDRFEAAWPKLEVEPNDFVRTTQARHEARVQDLWRTIEANGDLELGTYEGWYCVGCEEFKTEKDLLPGNLCPLHRTPVEWQKGDAYFFKLSRYEQKLLAHYATHPEFVEPESRRNEVVSFVSGGLHDLSVSRSNFTWGIPVPGDPKHVMFVWFDALANYWSVLQGDPRLEKFWSDAQVIHFVGKDILRFHAVYWPAFLMSAELPLPRTVFAHGFLTFNGQKMSKSLRNAVDPIGIAQAFGAIAGSEAAGADVLRYQLLRAIAFGQDGDFDLGAMIERYNADLGKNLGNLLARTLGLCAKMTGGKVPPVLPSGRTSDEASLEDTAGREFSSAAAFWDRLQPHRALEETIALSTAANVYVDKTAPWAEAKKGNTQRVDTILGTLLQVLECLSVMIWPVLPHKSDEMRAQLGLSRIAARTGTDLWPAALKSRLAGQPLSPGGALFPTIDEDVARSLKQRLTPSEAATANGNSTATATPTTTPTATATATPTTTATATTTTTATPTTTTTPTATPTATTTPITHDHLSTVDLRVGVVRTAERVPKRDKLLKLAIDLGEAAPRIIIAGLALSFRPEELVGRKVIVVANLAPRDFGKGLVSHGMLLATGPSEKLVLATVEGDAAPGARLK
jgi:methionyl-tRNA synthetase